jgi:hypothetical protein
MVFRTQCLKISSFLILSSGMKDGKVYKNEVGTGAR